MNVWIHDCWMLLLLLSNGYLLLHLLLQLKRSGRSVMRVDGGGGRWQVLNRHKCLLRMSLWLRLRMAR